MGGRVACVGYVSGAVAQTTNESESLSVRGDLCNGTTCVHNIELTYFSALADEAGKSISSFLMCMCT